jgi:N-hydroxyarylamine O-acetyltransferase
VSFNLESYLSRVSYRGDRAPTAKTLADLHLAHATKIPFENADILLGRPIRLDQESLQAKLVTQRRGGYCFEHNLLFAAALEELGFRVTRLAARVRYEATRLLPRTHMLLRVEADDRTWLADVGFGGGGLLQPVPLEAGQVVRQFAWTYRVIRESDLWVLQSLHGQEWKDLYAFTLEPQEVVDYEMASFYVSTHPQSPFVQRLTVQLPTPEGHYILRNRELVVDRGDSVARRTIADDELVDILAKQFGLEFPPDTKFP